MFFFKILRFALNKRASSELLNIYNRQYQSVFKKLVLVLLKYTLYQFFSNTLSHNMFACSEILSTEDVSIK